MEVKINSADEIVFIEVGARLSGGDTHLLVRDARKDGKSQLEYTVDAHLGSTPPDPAYGAVRHAVRAYVIATRAGRLVSWNRLDEIRLLPSFRRMSLHAEPGAAITHTVDLATDAGWIDLAHTDFDVLRADEARLDTILKDGIFTLA